MIVRAIGRLILVPLGLLLGAFAAFAVLLLLGLEIATQVLVDKSNLLERLDILVDLGFRSARLAAVATLVPALVVVIVGEVARIRSALYYVAGGGIALAALPLLGRLEATGGVAMPSSRLWAVLATAGFAGGLVYWLVAGRRA